MMNSFSSQTHDSALIDEEAQIYGAGDAVVLARLSEALNEAAQSIVERFYAGISRLPRSRTLLQRFPMEELEHLKSQQMHNLLALSAPDLTAQAHRSMALRVGRMHAITGLEHEDLVNSRDVLVAAVYREVDVDVHSQALCALNRRLTRDLSFQAEAYQQLQSARQRVVLSVSHLATKVESYSCLIDSVVEILGQHEEIAGCAIGRPDNQGTFKFEAVSGDSIARYLGRFEEQGESTVSMRADRPEGEGPAGMAWRSGEVERVINIAADPHMTKWRDRAHQAGFRSLVVIPIRRTGHGPQFPQAILVLYSALPGGYVGADQRNFIGLIQTLMELALSRVGYVEGRTVAVPHADRRRWASLLRSEGLEMYYQPLLDLKTGRVTKVEALARLHDGGKVLAPGQFLPSLSSNDFYELFARGLDQALQQRSLWSERGTDLGISVNLPPSALGDMRYFEATAAALRRYPCAPDQLTLEVLETEELPDEQRVAQALAKFKALGVSVAQDDLGAGHSSLSRLRALPFDWIKIDRNIANLAGHDSSDVLRFIFQLTRLGHSLGKSVVVEGVEDPELIEALCVLDADLVQGYGIARPMPADQLITWMEHHQRALPEFLKPKSTLGKLAKLLIWEESMHLNGEFRGALARVPERAQSGASAALPDVAQREGNPAPACQSCLFARFPVEMDAVLSTEVASADARRALIGAALTSGVRSEDYRSARRNLVEQM